MTTLPLHELAALAAALCWAVSGLMARIAAEELGPLAFNRIRQTIIAIALGALVLAAGDWRQIDADAAALLIGSGLIGILLGDSLLFLALNRLGPRRTGVVFATNAPMAALMGWALLGETLSPAAIAGVVICALGVAIAVGQSPRPGAAIRRVHAWETVQGKLWVGVALGLGAAFGQAAGSLVARPAMEAGADPLTASFLRIAAAALALIGLRALPIPTMRARTPLTPRLFAITAGIGVIALGLGTTLVLYALQGGSVGVVSTLAATSPAMILPLIWLTTGERPGAGATLGAAVTIAGTALIFLR